MNHQRCWASPLDFVYRKLPGKITNSHHVILGCYECHKYMPKHPKFDPMTTGCCSGSLSGRKSRKSIFQGYHNWMDIQLRFTCIGETSVWRSTVLDKHLSEGLPILGKYLSEGLTNGQTSVWRATSIGQISEGVLYWTSICLKGLLDKHLSEMVWVSCLSRRLKASKVPSNISKICYSLSELILGHSKHNCNFDTKL